MGLRLLQKSKFYFPPVADLLTSYYRANNKEEFYFFTDMVPPTSNLIWRTSKSGHTYLTEDAKKFRQSVASSLAKFNVPAWVSNPTGVLAAIIIVESPAWVPKNPKKAKDIVRKSDIDNRIKSCFDAIDSAIGFPDARVWDCSAHKLYSDIERTHIFLFELGVTIEYNKNHEQNTEAGPSKLQ